MALSGRETALLGRDPVPMVPTAKELRAKFVEYPIRINADDGLTGFDAADGWGLPSLPASKITVVPLAPVVTRAAEDVATDVGVICCCGEWAMIAVGELLDTVSTPWADIISSLDRGATLELLVLVALPTSGERGCCC